MSAVRSLYICYFGLREPLVQTQVLPYLRELARAGVTVSLLTFESQPQRRWDVDSIEEWRTALRANGIEWFMSTYRRRPAVISKLIDIALGTVRSISIVRRHGVDVVHGRSDVGAIIGALTRRFTGTKLIFDMRGLAADEFAESGNWRAGGLLYRLTKRAERRLHRTSDALVVLTERARQELGPDTPLLEVIPCCVDRARFAPLDAAQRDAVRNSLGARDRIVIVYSGSLGGAYPTREIANFYAAAKGCDDRVFPLVLTHTSREEITGELAAVGFGPADHHVACVAPDAMPRYVAASDAGLSMIRPGHSKLAMSPTKFAEYLACGVPVISSRGIGDLDAQIEGEKIGALLDGFDAASYRRAFQALELLRRDPALQRRCLAVAEREYDLHAVGGVRYVRLYRRLTGGSTEPLAAAI